MISRIREAWRVLRPRAVAQTHRRLDELRTDLRRLREDVEKLTVAVAEQTRQQGAAAEDIRASVARLVVRESQLRAILRRDAELEGQVGSLESVLSAARIGAHVRQRFAASQLQHDPLPHLVIDRVLPDDLYEALITGLPPAELFHERRPNKRQMLVPFELAPAYSRRVWDFMSRTILPTMIVPEMVEGFHAPLTDWMRYNFPALGEDPLGQIRLKPSDGRILLRTRGYVIPPHRDPKWGFLTGLLYLARPGDSPTWGTQLYAVADDDEARGVVPHWIDKNRCCPMADVAFVPNRLLVFLNSIGAHGANIPEDAQPESLERYAFQFRVGPGESTSRRLIGTLPAERRPFWSGKAASY